MSPIQILAITALIVSVIGVCLYDYIERKIKAARRARKKLHKTTKTVIKEVKA